MSFIKHLLPAWRRELVDKSQANEAILTALDKELTTAEEDAIVGKVELSLETSTGEWLNQYGDIFGVVRRDEEDDDTYRSRIIEYVKLKRGTIPAIKLAIRDFLQDFESHIEIYEPYTNIFYLNRSKLNGKDHMLGHYYTFAVIDIKLSRPFPLSIIEVIDAFRPAGVRVHLTFRPNGHNPDADIIEMPLAGSNFDDTSTRLTIMNGLDDILRGHLTLSKRARDEDDLSGLFTLNKSKLNSLDRLAGSLSAAQGVYNLATYSEEDLEFSESTSIDEIIGKTEPLSQDFYTRTDKVNDQYAETSISLDTDNYLYFTLDLFMYFDLEYRRYLMSKEPSGVFDKHTYASLMNNTELIHSVSAIVSPSKPLKYVVEAFNLSSRQWDSLGEYGAVVSPKKRFEDIDEVVNYITDSGMMFTRIKLPKDKDRNEDVNVRLYFYELSFNSYEGTRIPDGGLDLEVESESDSYDWVERAHWIDLEADINPELEIDLEADIDDDEDSIIELKNKLWGTDFEVGE